MIKPEEIPQYTGDLELLEKAHGDLKTIRQLVEG